ncbi:ABC transporter ATP-binding protein [Teredinibacter waterburyi]|jgi:ATPase components of various ABC-type transport systems, contain duplicated ATPase|uniref:ABC transporter ATP-binding protein n=1 Tax=Teredinibacter waterburyi TaxID=1500538 RepID=UPI00165FA91F|nr:ABC transporter ATP-binding protein [Teredinibacter waterburyi]
MSLLTVSNLTTRFYTREGITTAVDKVSFTVKQGEILGIVGESGSGKSVCCYSLMGLIPSPPGKIESGSALFQGQDLLKLSERELRKIRGNSVAMIFQDPMTSLTPHMTIGEQLIEAYRVHNKSTSQQAKLRAIKVLQEVGITNIEQRMNAYPHEFSGGMRQRVMIAMALITEPKLLIADEPTTALDVTVQAQILQLIKNLQISHNLGVIFITHDLAVISQLADDIVVMKNGEVVEAATANALFRSPQHPYTQSLIAAIPDSAKPKNRHAIEVNAGDEIKANAAATPLVEVKGLSKSYSLTQNTWFFSKKREFKAVDNVSFDIFKGEILGLVGESGSGKSTLGRSVIRLLDADANVLRIDNTDLQSLGADDLRRARKNLQMIFQDPFASLNPRFTVFDTLAEPLLVHGIANKNNLLQKINELLDDVGLERKHIRKYPHEFSGGQRQRIAIARALAPQPKLIIADEPVSALDVTIQAQILELLLELTQKHGLTMLFISHDLSVVRYLCDRVMVMNKGQIVEQGETEALFSSPKNSYTQQLLSAIPTLKVSA